MLQLKRQRAEMVLKKLDIETAKERGAAPVTGDKENDVDETTRLIQKEFSELASCHLLQHHIHCVC